MRFRYPFYILVSGLGLAACLPSSSSPKPGRPAGSIEPSLVIDDFRYANNFTARNNWVSKDKSPQVNRTANGLRLDIPFHQDRDRVYWQRDTSLNLEEFTSFRLDLTAENPSAMRSLAVYFKSGPGWYIWNQPIPSSGQQSLQMPKTAFQTEGCPRGWHQIDAIRISPWKGRDLRSHLVLHGLYARQDSVLLIQGTRSIQGSSEKRTAEVVTRRLSGWLSQAGISHNVLKDEELLVANLNRISTVILSYHHVLPKNLRSRLEDFMDRGGQLIVFFCKDPKLASAMGFKLGEYIHSDVPGRWAAMEFPGHEPDHFPETVIQESWNIRPAWPNRKDARIIGHWVNANGEKQPEPAWVASRQGAWMSHILLGGDQVSKQHLLLALIGRKDPHAWRQASSTLLRHLVKEAGATDFSEAMSAIGDQKGLADNPQQVMGLLEGSRRLYNKAIREYQASRYPQSAHFAYQSKHLLMRAFGLVQTGRSGERRGVWDHHGVGWYPGDWNRTLAELKYAGFDHVYANLQWGGLAHYPSRVLPHSHTFRSLGDQAMAFRKAALKNRMKAHSWIVLWKLQNTPKAFLERMGKEDRLQIDSDGKVMPWLNPVHPENQNMMLKAIEEMLTGYKMDGIHLDYVRYPNDQCSYDSLSRVKFEAGLGRKVSAWPADVSKGGILETAYTQFRADQITAFVRSVRQLIDRVKPDAQLSAAVFGKYPECRKNVGQDWKRWLDEDLVDYLTPMNYTPYTSRFEEWVREQTQEHADPSRILPGIGVTAAESNLSPSDVINQIKTTREFATPGFVLFDLDASLREDILPYLTPGILRD